MDIVLDLLNYDFLGKDLWLWFLFIGIVMSLLTLDLGVFHKDNHIISVKESLALSAGYISLALLLTYL